MAFWKIPVSLVHCKGDINNMNIQSKLSKYISDEAAEKISTSAKGPSEVEVKSGIVSFILIQIKDDELNDIDRLITSASSILMEQGFMIVSVVSSLVVATIGFPVREVENPIKICERVVKELAGKHPHELKLLYGSLSGKYGAFGHPKSKRFGPILPKFGELLNQLTALKYGELQTVK